MIYSLEDLGSLDNIYIGHFKLIYIGIRRPFRFNFWR